MVKNGKKNGCHKGHHTNEEISKTKADKTGRRAGGQKEPCPASQWKHRTRADNARETAPREKTENEGTQEGTTKEAAEARKPTGKTRDAEAMKERHNEKPAGTDGLTPERNANSKDTKTAERTGQRKRDKDADTGQEPTETDANDKTEPNKAGEPQAATGAAGTTNRRATTREGTGVGRNKTADATGTKPPRQGANEKPGRRICTPADARDKREERITKTSKQTNYRIT